MNMPLRKNIHNVPQGPPNPGFMQEKVQKGDFIKKPLRELKLLLLFQVPMNLLKAWNTKLQAASFFAVKNPIQEVCWRFLIFNQNDYNWNWKN